jgi:hypothetical protein
MKRFVHKLKLLNTSGYCFGYRVVLFLWRCPYGCFPIGFALWHKESPSIPQQTQHGLSLLRNTWGLKPLLVLADGAYSTDAIVKRLTDYGWAFLARTRKDRLVDGKPVQKRIGRGYGNCYGHLHNGTKVKVFRSRKHFLLSNRMSLTHQAARAFYQCRWNIEEAFRAIKTILGLKGCHQVGMRAQAVYILMCLLGYSVLVYHSTHSVYKLAQQVNSGEVSFQNLLATTPFLTF